MEYLDRIKSLIGLDPQDTEYDVMLLEMVENVIGMILIKIPKISVVPMELDWIIVEAVVKRYNKLGSEGLTTETNEGVQFIYSKENLIEEYLPFIEDWLWNNPEYMLRGRFKMM